MKMAVKSYLCVHEHCLQHYSPSFASVVHQNINKNGGRAQRARENFAPAARFCLDPLAANLNSWGGKSMSSPSSPPWERNPSALVLLVLLLWLLLPPLRWRPPPAILHSTPPASAACITTLPRQHNIAHDTQHSALLTFVEAAACGASRHIRGLGALREHCAVGRRCGWR